VTPEVSEALKDMFEYQPWTIDMQARGRLVREALELAAGVIIANVPPSPDRSVAIRKLREARMDANSAITHEGKY
jgi:hypothetical protein